MTNSEFARVVTACQEYEAMIIHTELSRDECIDRLQIVYGCRIADEAVALVEETMPELN